MQTVGLASAGSGWVSALLAVGSRPLDHRANLLVGETRFTQCCFVPEEGFGCSPLAEIDLNALPVLANGGETLARRSVNAVGGYFGPGAFAGSRYSNRFQHVSRIELDLWAFALFGTSLRGWREQSRAGSSPVSGTAQKPLAKVGGFRFFPCFLAFRLPAMLRKPVQHYTRKPPIGDLFGGFW